MYKYGALSLLIFPFPPTVLLKAWYVRDWAYMILFVVCACDLHTFALHTLVSSQHLMENSLNAQMSEL